MQSSAGARSSLVGSGFFTSDKNLRVISTFTIDTELARTFSCCHCNRQPRFSLATASRHARDGERTDSAIPQDKRSREDPELGGGQSMKRAAHSPSSAGRGDRKSVV